MLVRITAGVAALWFSGFGVAHGDPQPQPSPPPDAPKCMSVNNDPFPHMQYLPCGWSWNGHWIPPSS